MRTIMSISLSDELLSKVKIKMKQQDTSSSELVRTALAEYFFKEEFSRLRKKALLEALKRGKIYSDEEIFKKVS